MDEIQKEVARMVEQEMLMTNYETKDKSEKDLFDLLD